MTKKKTDYELSEEDKRLFRDEMAGAKLLSDDNKVGDAKPKQTSSTAKPRDSMDSLHNSISKSVGSEEFIEFNRPGIQDRQMQRLRRGQFPTRRRIDLHGFIVAEARGELQSFINEAFHNNIKYVRVIHGKGYGSTEGGSILKDHVNSWLRQMSQVLAFCSCQPKDGGNGAVYVLLKTALLS